MHEDPFFCTGMKVQFAVAAGQSHSPHIPCALRFLEKPLENLKKSQSRDWKKYLQGDEELAWSRRDFHNYIKRGYFVNIFQKQLLVIVTLVINSESTIITTTTLMSKSLIFRYLGFNVPDISIEMVQRLTLTGDIDRIHHF